MRDVKVISTPRAWHNKSRPYSQALRVGGGDLVFCTGLVSKDPTTGEILCLGDVEGQTRIAFDQLRSLMEAAGGSLADIVQLRMYYAKSEYVAAVLAVRSEYITEPPFPAVTSIVSELSDPDLLVEIDAIAVV
jgi:enamine deaminase RidA (YjgF/YER057c/UK114 family)